MCLCLLMAEGSPRREQGHEGRIAASLGQDRHGHGTEQ
jgi:hypothetical protein